MVRRFYTWRVIMDPQSNMLIQYMEIYERTATSKSSKPNIYEIKTAIGIILYMGIVQLLQRRMYWECKTRVDLIADAKLWIASRRSYVSSIITIITAFQITGVHYSTEHTRSSLWSITFDWDFLMLLQKKHFSLFPWNVTTPGSLRNGDIKHGRLLVYQDTCMTFNLMGEKMSRVLQHQWRIVQIR